MPTPTRHRRSHHRSPRRLTLGIAVGSSLALNLGTVGCQAPQAPASPFLPGALPGVRSTTQPLTGTDRPLFVLERVTTQSSLDVARNQRRYTLTYSGTVNVPTSERILLPPENWSAVRAHLPDGEPMTFARADVQTARANAPVVRLLNASGTALVNAVSRIENQSPRPAPIYPVAATLALTDAPPAGLRDVLLTSPYLAEGGRTLHRAAFPVDAPEATLDNGVTLKLSRSDHGRDDYRSYQLTGVIPDDALRVPDGRVFLPTRVRVAGLPDHWSFGRSSMGTNSARIGTGFRMNFYLRQDAEGGPLPDPLELELEAIDRVEVRELVLRFESMPVP